MPRNIQLGLLLFASVPPISYRAHGRYVVFAKLEFSFFDCWTDNGIGENLVMVVVVGWPDVNTQ